MPRNSKYWTFIHITLIPVYISLLIYSGFVPTPSLASIPASSFKLSNLLSTVSSASRQLLRTSRLAPIISSSFKLPYSISFQTTTTTPIYNMQFIARRSEERGNADHGWLKTLHTFSFAMYHDSNHEQFGPLRVINEDRVAIGKGFDTHFHREFEIFSYVVSGQLEHKDSMGNTEIMKRGDIQMTSAGTGISHSEKTYGRSQVHFLQIWAVPRASRLTPKYFTRHFTDAEKKDKFVKVVAPAGTTEVTDVREGNGPAPVHSPLTMYAGLLSPKLGQDGSFGVDLKGVKGYIHVVQTSGYNTKPATKGASIRIKGSGGELTLGEGDGAYINIGGNGGRLQVENVGGDVAEVLLFDMEE